MAVDVVEARGRASQAQHLAESFNLFRRVGAPELRCAVPQDRAVPGFIRGDGWEFAGTLETRDSAPSGFDPELADTFARWNGFYMFETWRRERPAR